MWKQCPFCGIEMPQTKLEAIDHMIEEHPVELTEMMNIDAGVGTLEAVSQLRNAFGGGSISINKV